MKRGTFYILTFFILIIGPLVAWALNSRNTEESFQAAKQYYERGEYDRAIEAYMGELRQGLESGALYYNMANCYLQKGDSIGKAIFFYRMAGRFIPRDTALLINLRYAKSIMKQADTPSGDFWALHLLRIAFNRFTLKEAFRLWNTCYFGCAIIFVLSMFVKKTKGSLRLAAILLFCLAITLLVPLRTKMAHDEKTGVIIVPITDARFEPFENAASKFPLYEGMEVGVLKVTKEWYKIKRPDGKVGWLPKESLWSMASPPF